MKRKILVFLCVVLMLSMAVLGVHALPLSEIDEDMAKVIAECDAYMAENYPNMVLESRAIKTYEELVAEGVWSGVDENNNPITAEEFGVAYIVYDLYGYIEE